MLQSINVLIKNAERENQKGVALQEKLKRKKADLNQEIDNFSSELFKLKRKENKMQPKGINDDGDEVREVSNAANQLKTEINAKLNQRQKAKQELTHQLAEIEVGFSSMNARKKMLEDVKQERIRYLRALHI